MRYDYRRGADRHVGGAALLRASPGGSTARRCAGAPRGPRASGSVAGGRAHRRGAAAAGAVEPGVDADYEIGDLHALREQGAGAVPARRARLQGVFCADAEEGLAAARAGADFLVMRNALADGELAALCGAVAVPVFARGDRARAGVGVGRERVERDWRVVAGERRFNSRQTIGLSSARSEPWIRLP